MPTLYETSLTEIYLKRSIPSPDGGRIEANGWLGGLPNLGTENWPKGSKGVPLHHLASISLADVAKINPDADLPKSGFLAFFLGEKSSRVIHANGSEPVEPPPNLPNAANIFGMTDRKASNCLN